MSSTRSRGRETEYDSLRDRVLTRGNNMEIEGHIRGMRDLDRVMDWVAFENRNQSRTWVLNLLKAQAETIRQRGEDGD